MTLCQSTVGIVARDSKGNVLLSCSEIHQQVATSFSAEALACQKATQIDIDMKWEKVIIEGDSLSIIKKCKMKSSDKSLVCAYIHDIQQLALKYKDYSFEYTQRMANSLTHSIANETMKNKREVYLVERVLESTEQQEERDRVKELD
ncbi:hypothetical protein J1N35_025646 [Gossypium stocksii]|uniref:RNase H type-1 domain-containing protein n=1 Tax=Gossypium stocksii TaxID=47602 RepID=A0A9D3V9D1_9ROSI|nr:hypothetical protein J1N35_025646 [Gossypium stocksii]